MLYFDMNFLSIFDVIVKFTECCLASYFVAFMYSEMDCYRHSALSRYKNFCKVNHTDLITAFSILLLLLADISEFNASSK